MKNVGLKPWYNMNNIYYKEMQKWKKREVDEIEVRENGGWLFLSQNMSFRVTLWSEKIKTYCTFGG